MKKQKLELAWIGKENRPEEKGDANLFYV